MCVHLYDIYVIQKYTVPYHHNLFRILKYYNQELRKVRSPKIKNKLFVLDTSWFGGETLYNEYNETGAVQEIEGNKR